MSKSNKKRVASGRELGLVLMQQLMDTEDLHYGLWSEGLELSLANVAQAQQNYTNMLLDLLPAPTAEDGPIRVLDIGCGTGHFMEQLDEKGYRVDGVVPSEAFSQAARERMVARGNTASKVFECPFQDMPTPDSTERYDVAIFSESFQYIPMDACFAKLDTVVKPGGMVIVSDFFRTGAYAEGDPGSNSFRGGKLIDAFYKTIETSPFSIESDRDITKLVSPGLDLFNDLLMNRLRPAGISIGKFMQARRPFLSWLIAKLFRKKFERVKYKYFSGLRCASTFERYKVYRVVVLRKAA